MKAQTRFYFQGKDLTDSIQSWEASPLDDNIYDIKLEFYAKFYGEGENKHYDFYVILPEEKSSKE